jgi:hypothetical protein
VALGIGLEETIKALAKKNGNCAGPWLDEVEKIAPLRARSKFAHAGEPDVASAALTVLHEIFRRMRAGYATSP